MKKPNQNVTVNCDNLCLKAENHQLCRLRVVRCCSIADSYAWCILLIYNDLFYLAAIAGFTHTVYTYLQKVNYKQHKNRVHCSTATFVHKL